jgi:uncharacterized protein YceK
VIAGLLTVLLCTAMGCGTMANLEQANRKDSDAPFGRMYGGVQHDMAWARKCFESTSGTDGKEPSLLDQAKGTYYLGVDLPCSLVGDTLTLPFTFLVAMADEQDSLQMTGGRSGGLADR